MNSDDRVKRNFLVGDKWLYYKIFTGQKFANRLLEDIIYPLSQTLLEQGVISKWFYIRYSDPNFHLRVRFELNDTDNIQNVISEMFKNIEIYVHQKLIWSVVIDTYSREIERYGTKTMEISEKIFHIDSESTVRFLMLLEDSIEGKKIKWVYSLVFMDRFLDLFGLGLNQKLQLMKGLKTNFGKEFNMSRPLKKQFDQKYRENRKDIDAFLNFGNNPPDEYIEIHEILIERDAVLFPIIQNLLQISTLEVSKERLISSYLHMFMNRLFSSNNRLHELLCYDFLYRHYNSMHAIQKKVLSK